MTDALLTSETVAKPKKRRRDKHAESTAQEILDKARREARPNTPAERRKIDAAGQCSLQAYAEWPEQRTPMSMR